MKLDPNRLGIAAGIVWASVVLLVTLAGLWTGWGRDLTSLLSSIYPGYALSYGGALLGALYGFVDGFVGLYLIAWIYNKLDGK